MALFLAGGGDAQQSGEIDRAFINATPSALPLAYIPHAREKNRHREALLWFKNTYEPLGLERITLIDDIAEIRNKRFRSIYFGGGDTARLLRTIRAAEVEETLIQLSKSIPIYGGSAGATVWGVEVPNTIEKGLNCLYGYSVIPHYEGSAVNTMTIALPEDAGIIIDGETYTVTGPGTVTIRGLREKVLPTNSSGLLTRL